MSEAFEIKSETSAVTAIEFLLDETGSMMSVWDQTIGGFNEYVNSQKMQPGTCMLSLTKFDSSGVRNEYQDADIQTVKLLDRKSYKPNACTNLYDAIGIRIKSLESRVSTFPENTSHLMVIMTDGCDNASSEFDAAGIKVLIKDKEASGWTFVFLGANQDAWSVGQTFGMSQGNTMTYASGGAGMTGAMHTLAAATTSYRGIRATGASASSANDFFSSMNTDAVQSTTNTKPKA